MKNGWKTDGKFITHFYKDGKIMKSVIIQEGEKPHVLVMDEDGGIKRTPNAPSFEKAREWVKRYIKNHKRG